MVLQLFSNTGFNIIPIDCLTEQYHLFEKVHCYPQVLNQVLLLPEDYDDDIHNDNSNGDTIMQQNDNDTETPQVMRYKRKHEHLLCTVYPFKILSQPSYHIRACICSHSFIQIASNK